MELQQVEYTCPACGERWVEWENPDDDWFRLGTNQTLCANCGKEMLRRIKENFEDEVLSSWTGSNKR